MTVLALILNLACGTGTGTINLDGAQHDDSVFSDDSVVADDSMTADDSVFSDDKDGDGYTLLDGDCNDADPDIHPDATEIWYDGVDQNCAGDGGILDYDQDGDMNPSWQYGANLGGTDCDDDGDGRWVNNCNDNNADYGEYADCDDGDPLRAPFNPEDNNNGVDDNCLNGVDGFGLTVTWDVHEDEEDLVGTITVTVSDDYVGAFYLAVGSNFYLLESNFTDPMAGPSTRVYNVGPSADDDLYLNRNTDLSDVAYLYQSTNGIASLGTYYDETHEDWFPNTCAVWGMDTTLIKESYYYDSWRCTDVSADVYSENGNWSWDGSYTP